MPTTVSKPNLDAISKGLKDLAITFVNHLVDKKLSIYEVAELKKTIWTLLEYSSSINHNSAAIKLSGTKSEIAKLVVLTKNLELINKKIADIKDVLHVATLAITVVNAAATGSFSNFLSSITNLNNFLTKIETENSKVRSTT